MKIVMFTNTYYPAVGGIEKSIETFSSEMRRYRHRVLVVAPQYESVKKSTDEVLRVPAIKNFAGTPYSFKTYLPLSIARRIDDFKPDIIHSHQPFLLGDSALRVARRLNVPLIYSNHTFMERYLYLLPMDWAIFRGIAEKLPVAYANLSDHVITPTKSVAEKLRERGVVMPISIIPTGIDADFYAAGNREEFRKKHNLESEHFVLGHLGRLNPEKNLDYLARVALEFVNMDTDRRRFLLVGSGRSVTAIESLFAENGASKQLLYVGEKKGQDSADAYAVMDAFIFTSLTDTQGLVLSEAMAAGNPVFALDAPGARDIVDHESNGYLFSQDTSAREFAVTMDRIICDREKLCAMQRAACVDARKLSIPNCTETMLELYQSVIKSYSKNTKEISIWHQMLNRWEVEIDLVKEKLISL